MKLARQFFILCIPIIILIAIVSFWKINDTKKIKYSNSVEQTTSEIMRVIPIGTTMAEAKAIMTKNGFSCSETNSLECDLTSEGSFGFKGTQWYVEFLIVSGRISDAKVEITPAPKDR